MISLRSRARAPIAVLASLALAGTVAACSGGPGPGTSSSPAPSSGPATDCPTSQPPALPAGETRAVTIETALGSMVLTVEADLSPIAVGNFVALASCGYYDGVVFHRVVPGFVIQGGDRSGTGGGGPGYTIPDEPVTAEYGRGVVAMARSARPNSVGSQFFIVLEDGARGSLASANTYQIVGHVTSGMETADAVADAADQERPSAPIVMTDVSVTTP
jgi:cyclophilin family peptidyl-prolyl cis-trans isomerase